jgi:hypothetical protein
MGGAQKPAATGGDLSSLLAGFAHQQVQPQAQAQAHQQQSAYGGYAGAQQQQAHPAAQQPQAGAYNKPDISSLLGSVMGNLPGGLGGMGGAAGQQQQHQQHPQQQIPGLGASAGQAAQVRVRA